MAQLSFDSSTVAPQESLAPIPAGVYLAHVIESDVVPLKSGKGSGLQLTFQVLEGPCANRKVWTSLNIRHENQVAEQIAQSQLSAICHAIGVPRVNDTVQLHGKPMRIRVTIRKDDTGQYGDKNEIKGFEPAGGAPRAPGQPAMPAAAYAPPPAAAPAQPAAATPPWGRRAA